MEVKRAVSKYFNAAQIESLPLDLSAPRFEPSEPSSEARRIRYERCRAATAIWDAANTRAGRLQALKNYQAENTLADTTVAKLMGPFLNKASNRLPLNEIEDALRNWPLQRAQHRLSLPEKDKLDREGYLNLGQLLNEEQLVQMRRRYDIAIERTVINLEHRDGDPVAGRYGSGPINGDGLLDSIFASSITVRCGTSLAPILNLLVPTILRTPGYGHQGIHVTFCGVKGAPLVVNAVWLIDEFTEENGATRVVPKTHRSGVHPTGDLVRGEPRDLNKSVEGEIKLTGAAGCCFVYNAHLWHGGTQNCTNKLRRAQHCFFGHSEIPSSTDVPYAIEKNVYSRMGQIERAILDIK